MGYLIRELVYTIQGEGANAGRPAILCRFSDDKEGCRGILFTTPSELANEIVQKWPRKPDARTKPVVVCTGKRVLHQLDSGLICSFRESDFQIAVEIDGSSFPPGDVDWVSVKPKPNKPFLLSEGDELKLEYPQTELNPESFEHLNFRYFFLQPKETLDWEQNIQKTVNYCLRHPQWRIALQIHKILGLP